MRFNPAKEGLEAILGGPLEVAVMETLWQTPTTPVNIKWVFKRIEYDKELAYTTVAATMNRMAEKGLILCTRTPSFALGPRPGKERCLYRTFTTREEYIGKIVRGMMESIVANPELSPSFHEWLGMYISTPYHA